MKSSCTFSTGHLTAIAVNALVLGQLSMAFVAEYPTELSMALMPQEFSEKLILFGNPVKQWVILDVESE